MIIQFVVGDGRVGTPEVGANEYYNEDIDESYVPYKNGYGYLFEGRDFSRAYGLKGFVLLNGSVFGNGEMYTFVPQKSICLISKK